MQTLYRMRRSPPMDLHITNALVVNVMPEHRRHQRTCAMGQHPLSFDAIQLPIRSRPILASMNHKHR